jgi:hypothetical protein
MNTISVYRIARRHTNRFGEEVEMTAIALPESLQTFHQHEEYDRLANRHLVDVA